MESDDLKRLSLDGDQQAAAQLWVEAQRSGELEAACIAVSTLGDLEHFEKLADQLWNEGEHQRLQQLCERFGFILGDSERAVLSAMLSAAHGQRQVRLLSPGAVLSTVAACLRSPDAFAFRHAGSAKSGPNNPRTTACLAVKRDDATICLGISESAAARPSPGSGWSELAPWRSGKHDAKQAGRLRSWAAVDGLERLYLRCSKVPQTVTPEAAPQALQTLCCYLDELEALAECRFEVDELRLERFKDVLRLLEKWPTEEGPLDAALALAEKRLQSTPDGLRRGSKSFFARARKQRALPSDRLVRCLRRQDLPDPLPMSMLLDFAELPTCPLLTELECVIGIDDEASEAEDWQRFSRSRLAASLRRLSLYGSRRPSRSYTLPLAAFSGPQTFPKLERLELSDRARSEGLEHLDLPALQSLSATFDEAALRALLRSPSASRLRELVLRGLDLPPDPVLAVFAEVPRPPRLQRLRVNLDLLHRGAALRHVLGVPGLRQLSFGRGDIDEKAMLALASPPLEGSPTLTALDLPGARLGRAGCEALARSPHFAALQHLRIHGQESYYKEQPDELEVPLVFGEARFAPSLVWLELTRLRFEPGTLAALAARFRDLEVLVLRNCALTGPDVVALAASGGLQRLRHLDLSENPIGSEAVASLLASSGLPRLDHLELTNTELGPEGLRPIEQGCLPPSLRTLILNQNPVGNAAAKVLAEAEVLAQLDWLSLHLARITKPGVAQLEGAAQLEGRLSGLTGLKESEPKGRRLHQLRFHLPPLEP
ncbi:MAG: hypothetical protein RBU37_20610 [Myxococcota bacterium]|jgi:hypothetical protein|nr:hypothetical protein [Myxococcota bacterium]